MRPQQQKSREVHSQVFSIGMGKNNRNDKTFKWIIGIYTSKTWISISAWLGLTLKLTSGHFCPIFFNELQFQSRLGSVLVHISITSNPVLVEF